MPETLLQATLCALNLSSGENLARVGAFSYLTLSVSLSVVIITKDGKGENMLSDVASSLARKTTRRAASNRKPRTYLERVDAGSIRVERYIKCI
jgi:hypothetical protein